MKKKKFHKGDGDSEIMSLQITSMADIFTIILVFLLKSFASSSVSLSPNAKLPHIDKADMTPVVDSLMVEVLSNGIMVDQNPTVPLRNFIANTFPAQTLLAEQQTEISVLLVKALQKHKKKDEDRLILMADSKTPYATLEEVMKTIASSGFKTIQLIMIKDSG